MSHKTETSVPNTEEEAIEWYEETLKLAQLHEHLECMKDAKALGIPVRNLNDLEEKRHD
jgi:hypothetical protein